MTTYSTSLGIDFGQVGYYNYNEPFKVRLDAAALMDLIESARQAHRVYELLLITRPGDIWDYVRVTVIDAPGLLAERIQSARVEAAPKYSSEHPWPDGTIPFSVFDKLFFWSWDDTSPEDEAWLRHRESEVMRCFATQLFAMANAAIHVELEFDPLIEHVGRLVKSGTHPFDHLSRAAAVAADTSPQPNPPEHTPDFYRNLENLLGDNEFASVAYRGNGDYRVLRMLATTQRKRADRTGHVGDKALTVNALVNNKICNEAWGSTIHLYSEGLGHGDIFIEGRGIDHKSIKWLVETGHRSTGSYIYSWKDHGDISGYDKTTGDGWVLYKSTAPLNRRRCLVVAEHGMAHTPILAFDTEESIIHSHEKAIVLMGAGVSTDAVGVLADVLLEWRSLGGDPLIISEQDIPQIETIPGLRVLIAAKEIGSSERNALADWFHELQPQHVGWIDVVLSLNAPEWMCKTLNWRIKNQSWPWSPWAVATPDSGFEQVGYVLNGMLAERLRMAHQLAMNIRPKRQ